MAEQAGNGRAATDRFLRNVALAAVAALIGGFGGAVGTIYRAGELDAELNHTASAQQSLQLEVRELSDKLSANTAALAYMRAQIAVGSADWRRERPAYQFIDPPGVRYDDKFLKRE